MTTQSTLVDFSKSAVPDLAGLAWDMYSSSISPHQETRGDTVFPNLLLRVSCLQSC